MEDSHKDDNSNDEEENSREQQRIQELANAKKEAEAEAERLRSELKAKDEQLFAANTPEPKDDLERLQTGQAELQKKLFIDTIDRDRDYIEDKYPILMEDGVKDKFEKMYAAAIGYDQGTGSVKNDIRLRDFAETFAETIETASDSRLSDAQADLSRQASRTGVRPGTGSHTSGGELNPGDISNMSSDEYAKKRDGINAEINRRLGI